MSELTKEEIQMFDAVIEIYKEAPALALSCINKTNEEKFSTYLQTHFSKEKIMRLEYKELMKFVKVNSKVRK